MEREHGGSERLDSFASITAPLLLSFSSLFFSFSLSNPTFRSSRILGILNRLPPLYIFSLSFRYYQTQSCATMFTIIFYKTNYFLNPFMERTSVGVGVKFYKYIL